MFTLKHLFTSPQADGVDPTLVKPSDWNAQHTITSSTDGVMIGRPSGAGPGPMQELSFSSIMPTGVVLPFASAATPAGWLPCSGQLVNVSDYPTLFGVLGGQFGGNGVSTFGIPDMRGRVPAGNDAGVGRLNVWGSGLGVAGGIQQVQVRVYGNVHVDGSASVSGTLNGTISGSASAGAGTGAGSVFVGGTDIPIHTSGTLTGTSAGDGAIANNGNNVTDVFNVAQPFLMLNYIIKT